jgi:formate hydrogenlyase subunit 6/NADH:ubiquinone oxidoreductase subunit I
MLKPLPNLTEKPEDCCGCAACYSICPTQAIQMVPDSEGFDYPLIDADLCTCCYLCVKVCPIKKLVP